MSLPTVMITSEKATQKSMIRPSHSVPNAPLTTLEASGPSGTTTATSASFAFSSNETGSTFKCSPDGAPFNGQRQASARARDLLQLERGPVAFPQRVGSRVPLDPRSFHETYFEDLCVGILWAVAKEVLEEVPIGFLAVAAGCRFRTAAPLREIASARVGPHSALHLGLISRSFSRPQLLA